MNTKLAIVATLGLAAAALPPTGARAQTATLNTYILTWVPLGCEATTTEIASFFVKNTTAYEIPGGLPGKVVDASGKVHTFTTTKTAPGGLINAGPAPNAGPRTCTASFDAGMPDLVAKELVADATGTHLTATIHNKNKWIAAPATSAWFGVGDCHVDQNNTVASATGATPSIPGAGTVTVTVAIAASKSPSQKVWADSGQRIREPDEANNWRLSGGCMPK